MFHFKLFAKLGCFHVEVCDDQHSIADIRVQGRMSFLYLLLNHHIVILFLKLSTNDSINLGFQKLHNLSIVVCCQASMHQSWSRSKKQRCLHDSKTLWSWTWTQKLFTKRYIEFKQNACKIHPHMSTQFQHFLFQCAYTVCAIGRFSVLYEYYFTEGHPSKGQAVISALGVFQSRIWYKVVQFTNHPSSISIMIIMGCGLLLCRRCPSWARRCSASSCPCSPAPLRERDTWTPPRWTAGSP